MKVTELLESLKNKKAVEYTDEIKNKISQIKKICDSKYLNQSFYGNAALNRQMLLDTELAKLLTPDILNYLFTQPNPTPLEKINRNSTGQINLRDAIFYGFNDGLYLIKMMPNNEADYSPQKYSQQKDSFANNTLPLVNNIEIASGEKHSEQILALEGSLSDLLTYVANQVQIIKQNGGSNVLLFVPGYTPQNMRDQVGWGFNQLLSKLSNPNLANETLESLCQQFLSTPEAILDGRVVHLFYDRAHFESALEQNTTISVGGKKYTYRDLFDCMVKELDANPELYSEAREQFALRLNLVKKDLDSRKTLERYKAAVEPENRPAVETENTTAVETENRPAVETENKTVVEPENRPAVEPEVNVSSDNNFIPSMQILSGFVKVLGGAMVCIALTAVCLGALSVTGGAVLGVAGIATTLAGFSSLFKAENTTDVQPGLTAVAESIQMS